MANSEDVSRLAEGIRRDFDSSSLLSKIRDLELSRPRLVEFSLPRLDFEFSTASKMREIALSLSRFESLSAVRLAADIRAQMAPVADLMRQDRLLLLGLVGRERFSDATLTAEEFRRSMLRDQQEAARSTSDLARLIMSSGIFSQPEIPTAPSQLDRIEERVAAIEETLTAAFAPEEEPAKEEEDDRPWPAIPLGTRPRFAISETAPVFDSVLTASRFVEF